jgi:hypothetical protein
MGALGYWGRGLAIARSFARVRKVDGGKPLCEVLAHVRTMAKNMVTFTAMLHLGYFTVYLLGISEHPESFSRGDSPGLLQDKDEAIALLRLLTAVTKARCAKMAIHGLQECMEALGGVGYLEDEQEYNVARLFRDCNVHAIWEGTTDIMAHDVVRVMKGKEGSKVHTAFKSWAERHADSWRNTGWKDTGLLLKIRVANLCKDWTHQDAEQLRYRGREMQEELAWTVATISLVTDAMKDSNPIAVEIAQRWASQTSAGQAPPSMAPWKEEHQMNARIAFPVAPFVQARL